MKAQQVSLYFIVLAILQSSFKLLSKEIIGTIKVNFFKSSMAAINRMLYQKKRLKSICISILDFAPKL